MLVGAGAGTYRHWLRSLQSGWSVISVGPRLNGSSLIGVGRSRSKDFSPSMMRDWPQRQAQVRWSCPTMGGGNSMAFHRPSIRSEEHTSELQSLMRISYAVFCLKKKTTEKNNRHQIITRINPCYNKKQ